MGALTNERGRNQRNYHCERKHAQSGGLTAGDRSQPVFSQTVRGPLIRRTPTDSLMDRTEDYGSGRPIWRGAFSGNIDNLRLFPTHANV
jgi:hypothetical protein